jgi:hypothetical protein
MVGVTGIGAGVRCHLLDDRGMIVNKRSVRSVVEETRKFTGNGITRQQDARFKRLNLEAALPLALVTTRRRAMPTPDGQPAHKLPPQASAVIFVDQHFPERPPKRSRSPNPLGHAISFVTVRPAPLKSSNPAAAMARTAA